MATRQSTVDELIECLAGVPSVSARKMFGEYALYHEGKVVALVCDDELFVKITPGTRPFLDEENDAPPYPGAKPHMLVPRDKWDDKEWLTRLILTASSDVKPPKKKSQQK